MSTNHLPPAIAKAVEQQQTRIWSLRSLLDVVLVTFQHERCAESVDDMESALVGIIEVADSIHLAMDEQALADRASELKEDEAQRAEFVTGQDPGAESTENRMRAAIERQRKSLFTVESIIYTVAASFGEGGACAGTLDVAINMLNDVCEKLELIGKVGTDEREAS